MRLAVAFALISCATGAQAASLWDHNGSTVYLEANGATRQLFYETPRPGLPVTKGTLLFTGKRQGERYSGTAYIFSSKCGPQGYSVGGSVSDNEKRITLFGKAPRLDATCRVVGSRDDTLVFNFQGDAKAGAASTAEQGVKLHLGTTATGFHIPQMFNGRTITVVWPSNEHTIYAVEDMLAAAGIENDVLVGETNDNINNAFAVINGQGQDARRMIVFDAGWFDTVGGRGAKYRVILAHEIGHHVCGHTVSAFLGSPHAMELEADRAGGAILRKAQDRGYAIGGAVVGLDDIAATVGSTMSASGSASHPPGDQRLRAFFEGWRNGSPCLEKTYVPINPAPRMNPTAVQRIALHYGDDMRWDFRGAYVRTIIDGSQLRIVLESGRDLERAGAKSGSTIFEGTSDDAEKIVGTMWAFNAGCPPLSFPIEGKFVENNGIFLVGSPPKLSGCTIVDRYAPLLHLFKNTSDWGYQQAR